MLNFLFFLRPGFNLQHNLGPEQKEHFWLLLLSSGSLSRKFDVLQGTGLAKIPALFTHTRHSCPLSLYSISLDYHEISHANTLTEIKNCLKLLVERSL